MVRPRSTPGRPAPHPSTPTRPRSPAPEQLGANRYLVSGHLTGNFPGGTANLNWDFTIADDQITHLVIAP